MTPRRAPGRRHLLGALGLLPAAALLAACGTDTSDRYDSGYVGGDGVTTEIPPEDRAEPLDFTGTTYTGEEFAAGRPCRTASHWAGWPPTEEARAALPCPA